MDNNCHIADFVQVYSYVENSGFKASLIARLYTSCIQFHYIDNDVSQNKQT